jgi:hypothetical protein
MVKLLKCQGFGSAIADRPDRRAGKMPCPLCDKKISSCRQMALGCGLRRSQSQQLPRGPARRHATLARSRIAGIGR